MKDPDIELSKWKLERRKGSLSFVARTCSPAIFGVMVGRAIEPMFMSEEAWGWAQASDIFISGFWASLGAIPLSFVIWWWRERKYKRHIARFESHT
ncbi:hypothetical protein EK599_18750 [Vibrio sp. T187]|uniref:hypothetical protein n=1 Tax=Vibrio TaxID=662 RepID=UPI0010C9D15E|nr:MULTISPECIES: hypothetical protein [Vibrio]MBW3697723.1 hypothetical protein [Vibrio sp. T187]